MTAEAESATSEDLELLSAMEELQRAQDRVAKLRQQHREKAIAEVAEKIRMYDLRLEEMGFGKNRTRFAAPRKGAPSALQKGRSQAGRAQATESALVDRRSHVQAKYQGPAGSSQQWSGRGKPPKWMVPLLQAGAKKEDFLVKSVDAGNNKE